MKTMIFIIIVLAIAGALLGIITKKIIKSIRYDYNKRELNPQKEPVNWGLVKIWNDKNISKSKYYTKRPLTPPEQVMYWKLVKALPEYVILAQVDFSSFIYAKDGKQKENYINFNKIKQKRADFLVCDKSFKIAAAIEIDDSSHDKEKDKKRDIALLEAGILTIRWNVGNLPTEEEIKNAVDRLTVSIPVNMEKRQHRKGKEHENDHRLPGRNQGKAWTELRLQTGQVSGTDNNSHRTLPQEKKHDG